MKTIFNLILRTIFWLTIIFIAVTFYSLTFGQYSTYEFADWKISRQFYDTVMQGLPVAILLTLTGTIKRTNSKRKNIALVIATVVGSIVSFLIMVSMLFSVGFLTTTNEKILYRYKTNPRTTITLQTIGAGALGTDGHRIVKLEPLLKFWNKTTIIDTTTIDKADWIFENKTIDSINDN